MIDTLEAEPRVLIDPNTFSEDRTASMSSFEVSPDGSLVAYSISEGGSDWRHWKVRDVETGEDLEDRLDGIKFSGASWSADGRGLLLLPLSGERCGRGRRLATGLGLLPRGRNAAGRRHPRLLHH